MTRIVELIETSRTTGKGTKEDPVRSVAQLWTKDGRLIAENDNWPFGCPKSWFHSEVMEGAKK